MDLGHTLDISIICRIIKRGISSSNPPNLIDPAYGAIYSHILKLISITIHPRPKSTNRTASNNINIVKGQRLNPRTS